MSDLRRARYYSIQQSADFWNVSTFTIRRRIADGTLPAYRIGKTIRIKIAYLEAVGRPIPAARVP